MTGRTASRLVSLALVLAGACTTTYEIPIDTPIQPKLDVSAFQRVLVVGFVAGGTDEVDTNLETVRLLRSQLRTKSDLKVIEADALPLAEIARGKPADGQSQRGATGQDGSAPKLPKDEKELEAYDPIFANVE